ncbi:hypothetical protein KO493_09625 [Tamlana agarivorans]|uniref:Uncharacterized protein n=1 Tax=Pseudotamlana agarivorans TaxID=481183 RepID=A0ACC5U9F5_9FLAO|nr:hypothetical protein [Tamlana agarivorans]MBU2950958.1 hypothetical protein [Tamlana agarivorans]
MKKLHYLFKSLLVILLFTSCSDDDSIETISEDRFVSNISLSKQNVFIEDEVTLKFETNNNETMTIVSENADVNLIPVSDTEYKISSTKAGAGYITITTTKGEIEQIDQVQVIFNAHGTEDYVTLEGVIVGESNRNSLLLLHGEPDEIQQFTASSTNETTGVVSTINLENWYYLSKGIAFTITDTSGLISQAKIYGTNWAIDIDGDIKQGSPYTGSIGTLGDFSTGILMDDVYAQNGIPTTSGISGPSMVFYRYADLNTSAAGSQIGIFNFSSDDVDDYIGKDVTSIVFL